MDEMTSEDIGNQLQQCLDGFLAAAPSDRRWNELRADLTRWTMSLPRSIAFEGMTWVLENREGYQEQWLAGDLLLRASLPCPLPMITFVQRILPRLNASADTVVKYMVVLYGREAVDEVVTRLRREAKGSEESSRLDTILYWSGQHTKL